MINATFLTESELAAAAERSRLYIRRARAQGLVIPIGSTGSGIRIYSPNAVADVRGIKQHVFGISGARFGAVMSEATSKVWEHYKKTGVITVPSTAKMYEGPANDAGQFSA